MAKNLKAKDDRKSRLQRRLETKEIDKDPKDKDSKPTKNQKLKQGLKARDKQNKSLLNSKSKKLSKKAQKEAEKERK